MVTTPFAPLMERQRLESSLADLASKKATTSARPMAEKAAFTPFSFAKAFATELCLPTSVLTKTQAFTMDEEGRTGENLILCLWVA